MVPEVSEYVVKRRRTIGDVEATSVLTHPLSKADALDRLNDLNAEYQNPGNYYIERWDPLHHSVN